MLSKKEQVFTALADDIKTSLELFTSMREKATDMGLDPRAQRVALKFLLLVDTQFAAEKITPELEIILDAIVDELDEIGERVR